MKGIAVDTYRIANDHHLPDPELQMLTVSEDPNSSRECRMFRAEQDGQYVVLSLNGARQLLKAIEALEEQGWIGY